jgi:23S rRNA pseudouridine2605 synthase
MIRLNKFISNSGLCTRREADGYIVDGRVHVDNQIVTTLGYKVSIDSEIRVDNKIIVPYSFQYIVLNKPIDFNFNSKKNIFDLIKSSEIDNLGLLEMVKDDFKGLVLFSNDNGLNKSFPFNVERIKQLFHITLKKPLTTQKLKYLQEKSIRKFKNYFN